MVTYTEFLESDISGHLMSYFKELMDKNTYIKEHEEEIRRYTNVFRVVTDDMLYNIYEILLNSVEEIEDEAQDYIDKLQINIDEIYED